MSTDAPSFTPEIQRQPFDRFIEVITPIIKCSEALVRVGDLFTSFEKVAAFGLKFRLSIGEKVFNLVYVPILSCLKIKAYGKL